MSCHSTVPGTWTHTGQRIMTTWAPTRPRVARQPCMWPRSTVITTALVTHRNSNRHEHKTSDDDTRLGGCDSVTKQCCHTHTTQVLKWRDFHTTQVHIVTRLPQVHIMTLTTRILYMCHYINTYSRVVRFNTHSSAGDVTFRNDTCGVERITYFNCCARQPSILRSGYLKHMKLCSLVLSDLPHKLVCCQSE